ncbi:aspartate aminotransferase family protein [Marivirga tractuosa]|uniref:Acetylornithine transaminase n=1 Tax=Marivirga tractuosa (strain ATCC 23168 / DSM 4126 / NBRC 15989 / NCIMB 1408 / VKM B-1430 / H-43) TaxID=643867 RepID=E4TT31_MARTH|nr:aspartate aminotransferase family protein [Marivirga tractuosa]ADR20879.1 Acetylornithine transaminase [Marivirga tractuosa DSM 4126]BDD14670.1 aspartate aminotransferase family protein [Marivirga tractuosa]
MYQSDKDIFLNNIAQTSPFPFLLEVESANGIYLNTKDGKSYMDLISGVAVSNLGHQHPKIVDAVKKQLEKHMHIMVYGEYVQSSVNKLAKILTDNLPQHLNSIYFCNSGAESIEGALKLAKRVTGRTEMLAFRGAYHGSTHGALSISSNENKKYRFRPLLPDVGFLRLNNFEDLSLITKRTACVVIESIQGDAGVRIPEQNFLEALRKKCTETGALLIMDEIQSGIGRTAKLFAFEHFGVEPDILCTAKALGGGLPLGAFIADKYQMDLFTKNPMLGHINTFGGNPMSCAAAVATLEVILEGDFLEEVERKGAKIEELISHAAIVDVRRKGLMFAFEFETDEIVNKIVQECLANGVICFWFLSCPNSFRIAPPLTITDEEIEKACKIINTAIKKVVK